MPWMPWLATKGSLNVSASSWLSAVIRERSEKTRRDPGAVVHHITLFPIAIAGIAGIEIVAVKPNDAAVLLRSANIEKSVWGTRRWRHLWW
jgi:hypothetical protein